MAKKSNEAVIEAADAPTDDKALSNASVTEPADNAATGKTEDGAGDESTINDPAQAPSVGEQKLEDPRDARIAALEADIAFLRSLFGWPTKDA